jgi:hypothetical protein
MHAPASGEQQGPRRVRGRALHSYWRGYGERARFGRGVRMAPVSVKDVRTPCVGRPAGSAELKGMSLPPAPTPRSELASRRSSVRFPTGSISKRPGTAVLLVT